MATKEQKTNLLFVCSANLNRSPTAEKWTKEKYSAELFEVRSAGIYHGYPYQLTQELIDWAHCVICMDLSHEMFIKRRFETKHRVIVTLGISDQYDRDSPELIELIEYGMGQHQEIIKMGKCLAQFGDTL